MGYGQTNGRRVSRAHADDQPALFEEREGAIEGAVEVQSRSILTRATRFMSSYDYTLNPYSGCVSGAVVVGAPRTSAARRRWTYSSRPRRVRCHSRSGVQRQSFGPSVTSRPSKVGRAARSRGGPGGRRRRGWWARTR